MFFRTLFGVLLLISTSLHAAPLPVAASFSILGDLVQNVGGERVSVTVLVGKDQDAHVFQPSPTDVQKLARTQLFFVSGLGFEGWQSRLLKSSKYSGKTVTVTQGIKPLAAHGDHAHSHGDPHVWQDPIHTKHMIDQIAAALIAADPQGREYFQKQAAQYKLALDQLLTWTQAEIGRVPQAKRVVLTSHDAFAYLGQRFGIRLLAPQGVSTDAEANTQDVARIIRQMKTSGIRAIFMENISNPKLMEQIAKETGAKPGVKLYSDALSRNETASTYLIMYRHNISALVAGMQANQ